MQIYSVANAHHHMMILYTSDSYDFREYVVPCSRQMETAPEIKYSWILRGDFSLDIWMLTKPIEPMQNVFCPAVHVHTIRW